MPKFSKFSEADIKDFAGDIIFERGLDYYEEGMVQDFSFDPDKQIIRGEIYGTVGIYTITAWNRDGDVWAHCDCPYEGNPCKHIVAVLLYYMHHKERYLKKRKEQINVKESIKEKLTTFSGDELIGILMGLVEKYPLIEREMMLQLSVDNKNSLKSFNREIDKIIHVFDHDQISSYETCDRLNEILYQVDSANEEIKIEIIWYICDHVLAQLTEYGLMDEPLEDLAIETMQELRALLNSNEKYDRKRNEIIKKLKDYSDTGNCGIIDDIDDALYQLEEGE